MTGQNASRSGIDASGRVVDTKQRYVYIHGSHEQAEMGTPGSIGCVRMRNADLIELYDLVPAGTVVDIA